MVGNDLGCLPGTQQGTCNNFCNTDISIIKVFCHTGDGKLSISRVAKYFKDENIHVTKIITSPLLRAWQTAQIVTDHLRLDDKIEESDHLLPESNPDDIIRELLKFNNDEKILLVSH